MAQDDARLGFMLRDTVEAAAAMGLMMSSAQMEVKPAAAPTRGVIHSH